MAKQTTLAEFHKHQGAVFTEHDGWLLPDSFGDSAAEYATVRSGAGLIDFSHRALLQFTGPDRLAFLQGMLSNDLRPLKMFEGQPSAGLRPQRKKIRRGGGPFAGNFFSLGFPGPLKEKNLPP